MSSPLQATVAAPATIAHIIRRTDTKPPIAFPERTYSSVRHPYLNGGTTPRSLALGDHMPRTFLIVAAVFLAGCNNATNDSAVATRDTAVGARVQVNGMQMYYEVSGTGDPLIVLHGAYMNIPTMGAIIPRLAETHKVYALEFQGHGRTTDI